MDASQGQSRLWSEFRSWLGPSLPWRDWCVTCHVSICAWFNDVATVITTQGTWPVTRGACPSSSSRHLAAVCPVTLVFTNMSVLTLILRDNILDSTINSSQFSPLRPVGCGAGRGGRCLYPSESGWILSSGAAVIGIIRDEAGVAAVDQPASSRADAD